MATTATTSQVSETATSKVTGTVTSGARGWDARFGLRGMIWSGAVAGWWLFGVGA